jgi:hypothetical protein
MSTYTFERVDDGWRAVVVEDNGSKIAVGPCFPTQTEAVLYSFDLDQAGYLPDESTRNPAGRFCGRMSECRRTPCTGNQTRRAG